MNTRDLYIDKSNCCGCELCSLVCPKNIIKMQPDREGFLYPFIDNDIDCINCNRCLAVCPEKSPGHKTYSVLESYGGYSLEPDTVKNSSSGGYATSISRAFIRMGGIVYGVKYTDDFTNVVYSRAVCLEDIEAFRTSKYTQAYKGTVFRDVLTDIKNHKKVLFIGLPCEVSALYHYVGINTLNLYTISLICHGPTSPRVQRDFISDIESKLKSNIISFSLRNKQKGWKPYYILAETKNGDVFKQLFKGSSYDTAFLYMKRPSCSTCRYKYGDEDFGLMSDITLGDFHSVRNNMPHYNPWGVSQLSIQSEKGQFLLELIRDNCKVEYIPKELIENGNIAFLKPIPMNSKRQKFVNAYMNHSLDYASHLPMILVPRYIARVKKCTKKFLVKIKHLL